MSSKSHSRVLKSVTAHRTKCKVSENIHQMVWYYFPSTILTTYLDQCTLLALLHMLMYISAWEFICSQSPHSMKGLVFGMFYFIRGLFQCMGVSFHILFRIHWKLLFMSCRSEYQHIIISSPEALPHDQM